MKKNSSIILLCLLILTGCNKPKLDDEVVHVNIATLTQDWESCEFVPECMDSLQSFDDYYWCLYTNYDQFEQTIVLSMDLNTFESLRTNRDSLKYKILFGHREECILVQKD